MHRELFAAASEILRSLSPHLRMTTITITGTMPDGQIVHIPVGDMGAWAFAVTAPVEEERGVRDRVVEAVLTVLKEARRPLKGIAIARKVGRKHNGRFRGILADLIREGKLVHLDRKGYVAAPESRTSGGESGSTSTPQVYIGGDFDSSPVESSSEAA